MDKNEAGRDYRKMIFIFLAIVLLVMASVIAWEIYKEKQLPRKAAELQREIDQIREQERQRLMADTYGGKTPQETLRMYIEAVEKGNYELASRYFIEENRSKEIINLKLTEQKDNISFFVQQLKDAGKENGSYSNDRDGFAIRKPILIDFLLYPNGIWKIIEI